MDFIDVFGTALGLMILLSIISMSTVLMVRYLRKNNPPLRRYDQKQAQLSCLQPKPSRRNHGESVEMWSVMSQPETSTLKETSNIAYGVTQQQSQGGSREEDGKEEVYYEIVGTETKRENVTQTSKDRSMLEDLYVL